MESLLSGIDRFVTGVEKDGGIKLDGGGDILFVMVWLGGHYFFTVCNVLRHVGLVNFTRLIVDT